MKQIELQMLIHVDQICRENNIDYSITYGTLLGAIRHKGFIPWDDDIDVMMTRENYERFLSVYRSDRYTLMTSKKDTEFWPLFSRVTDPTTKLEPAPVCNHGLWVAVVPYDKIPDNDLQFKWMLFRVKVCLKLNAIRRVDTAKKSKKGFVSKLFRNVLHVLLLPTSCYFWGQRAEKIKTAYRNKDVKRTQPWVENIIVPCSVFDEYEDVEFEGRKFMAIKRYDEFLRIVYNDYMQLPPESERVNPHAFKAYLI